MGLVNLLGINFKLLEKLICKLLFILIVLFEFIMLRGVLLDILFII